PPVDPLGSGGGWGDPHLYTPDGKLYDFHGYGEFIAMKSLTDNFEVQVRQGTLPYSLSTRATVNTGIAVQTGEDIVCITSNRPKLFINNIERDWNFEQIALNAGASIKKIKEGSYPVIVINSKKGDQVKVRLDASYISSYFDYSITPSQSRAGKVEGLLGNYDGNKNNDLRLTNGQPVENIFEQLYPAFADSWRMVIAESKQGILGSLVQYIRLSCD
ncbi:MAG: hypothetical protein EOP49_52030, partial [Sphingobacteriales bacterium]